MSKQGNLIEVFDTPTLTDVAALDDAIHAFNVAQTGIDDGRLLAIVLRTENGTMYAGLHGHTWGRCCEIKALWISEPHRRCGLGTAMLKAAECEAVARGCTRAVLSSHSFQAPAFYERHGYRQVATLNDYPAGHEKVLLAKDL